MNELKVFNNELFGDVRVLEIDGKIYFVGKDVAEALGYKNPSNVVNTKCKHKRKEMISHTENGYVVKTQTTLIDEGDVYRLIVNSKLPSAEKFEEWVFDEVLPSLRKNGVYAVTEETRGFSLYDQRMERDEKIIEGYKQVLGNRKKVTNIYVNTIKRELGVNSAKSKDYLNVKDYIFGYFDVESFEELPKNNMEVMNKIIQICREYDPGWSQMSMFDEE